jgi:hypothetical protein
MILSRRILDRGMAGHVIDMGGNLGLSLIFLASFDSYSNLSLSPFFFFFVLSHLVSYLISRPSIIKELPISSFRKMLAESRRDFMAPRFCNWGS